MPPSDGLVADLAGAILDGTDIDWMSADSSADVAERPLLVQLRLLAAVANLHRHLPDSGGPRPGATRQGEELKEWGPLRVLERIGHGAFGQVYRAWDTRLDREVALKLLPANPVEDDARGSSIINEGRLLARVRHPNVVTIYGAERIEDRIGLWMEFVKGRTLEEVLQEAGAFSATAAIDVGIELCQAVSAVHDAGLLHRDVKAQNVMLTGDGRVVLMDFGIGHERDSGSAEALAGTPLYLAPELIRREDASVRSDIYAIGVLLYHLVTGSYPVRARGLRDLRAAHERREHTDVRTARPDLPPRLCRIIERAIDPEPAKRYDSAGSLEADLATLKPRAGFARVRSSTAAAVVVLLFVWVAFEIRGGPARNARVAGAPAAAGVVDASRGPAGSPIGASPPRSIAVLPFKPVIASEADEGLQLGVTETVINQLSRIRTVRIEPLARVRRYDALDQDPLEAGRALGVEAVLEGHFQRTERGVQVRSRLLRTADGTALAASQWHEPFRNLLDVQSRLAQSVARAIEPTLTVAEQTRIVRQDTSSPDAYLHYLFGRRHLETRSYDRMLDAEREFVDALTLDPKYARAHAALSMTLTHMAWLDGRPGTAVMGAARTAALNALAIDDSVALAHTALAVVHDYFEHDPSRAQAEHLRAMEIGDDDPWVLRPYGIFLLNRDALDEAFEVRRRDLSLDPTAPYAIRQHAQSLYVARRYDECVAEARRAVTLDRTNLSLSYDWLGLCLEQQGNQRDAVNAWEDGRAARGDAELAGKMKRLFAAHGWEAYWRGRLRLAGPSDAKLAGAHVRLGHVDEAIQSLERLYEQRSPWIFFTNHPEWDPLRSDPRFQALRQRAGLSDQVNAELARTRRAAGVHP